MKLNKIKKSSSEILMRKPLIKISALIISYLFLSAIIRRFPTDHTIRIILDFLGIAISIYLIFLVILFIKVWIKTLLNPKNLLWLILSYILLVVAIIFTISILFNAVESLRIGYIKYGECSSKFDRTLVTTDPLISREFLYYTSVTFFTVGYGDICPMGVAKIISVFTAFTGHIISVIIVAVIINNYLQRKNEH